MDEVAVLGVGMHPWGKWGRNFTEYGVVAARAALEDAGVDYSEVGFVSGAVTVRCGYPGYVAGSTFARALGFTGAQIASTYSACASGAAALQVARGQILSGACDVALVVGADTTPKGFLAPNAGERPDDIDWLRFRLVGATNPVYFGLHARRRIDLHGATTDDFAQVKVKNSRHAIHNPNARFTKQYGLDDVRNSPVVSDPLRLLDICATSDGGAALVVSSLDWAKSRGHRNPVRVAGVSTVSPAYPDPIIDLPYLAADSMAGSLAGPAGHSVAGSRAGSVAGSRPGVPAGLLTGAAGSPADSRAGSTAGAAVDSVAGMPIGAASGAAGALSPGCHVDSVAAESLADSRPGSLAGAAVDSVAAGSLAGAAQSMTFKGSIAARAYAEAGLGPSDVDVAEVYDLSSAMELDWYEHLGFCAPGEAEEMLRAGHTSVGGRLPVNPSGGLGAFGEAVPAQAIAQVCELVWQLRGTAGGRQVEGARVGITVNQGLFGHGSSVLVRR